MIWVVTVQFLQLFTFQIFSYTLGSMLCSGTGLYTENISGELRWCKAGCFWRGKTGWVRAGGDEDSSLCTPFVFLHLEP